MNENDDIKAKLIEIDDYFKGRNYIEFYFEGDVSKKITQILSALKEIDSSYLDGTKLYYYNVKNAIIIQKN